MHCPMATPKGAEDNLVEAVRGRPASADSHHFPAGPRIKSSMIKPLQTRQLRILASRTKLGPMGFLGLWAKQASSFVKFGNCR